MGKPKIRFKGYEDDWEQRKFSEFVKNVAVRNREGLELECYAVTNDRGFISQKDAHDDFGYMVDVDTTAYNIVPPNSFAYNPARINVGSIGYYAGTENVIVSSLYEVFQTADYVDDRFLWHWFKSEHFPKWIERLQEGSVRLYFYYDKLIQCEIKMPSLEEQMKIGAYFNHLDHLITLHQRKCEETKSLKKYMLQKMFPENGKCVPEIRFSGFSDDWEQRKVSEIGNIVTGSTPKTSISDNYGGEFLFVSPADIQENRYVDETITTLTKKGFDQGRKIREKASLFVSIGSTIGKVAQTSQESTTNQQINAVEPYDNFDDDFIFTSLENISGSIKAIASNQAVPIVNKTTFGETEIKVPSELAEQQKIGAYFRNLDHLITLHQHKCDELQKLKKFMLQNMFV